MPGVTALAHMQSHDSEAGRRQIERGDQILAALPLIPDFNRALNFRGCAIEIDNDFGAFAFEEKRRSAVLLDAHLGDYFGELRLRPDKHRGVVDHLCRVRIVERRAAEHRQVALLFRRDRPAQLTAAEELIEAVVTLDDRNRALAQVSGGEHRRLHTVIRMAIDAGTLSPLEQQRVVALSGFASGCERIENLVAIYAKGRGGPKRDSPAGRAEPGHHAQREEGTHHQPAHPCAPPSHRPVSATTRHNHLNSNAHHQSPTSLTSGSSNTPLCSLTRARAISISARTSSA